MTYITDIEKVENLVKGFPTHILYRANFGYKRAYILPEPFTIFSGLTGALSACTFKGHIEAKRLDKWRDKQRADLGADNADAFLNQMSDFGTLSHMAIVKIKENGKIVWSEERDEAAAFFVASAKSNGINPNGEVIKAQVHEYCKVVASIMQWVFDSVVEIHSVEGMAYSLELGIGTPIDITATLKGGKTADFRTTINLKTSGQFGSHHKEQVAVEKFLWNSTYPDFKVEKTGLLRGKDWLLKKGIPTYEFITLDEAEETEILNNTLARLKLAKSHEATTYLNFPKGTNIFSGETKLGEAPTLAYKTLQELWNEEIKK